jgi:hypothetical protein
VFFNTIRSFLALWLPSAINDALDVVKIILKTPLEWKCCGRVEEISP